MKSLPVLREMRCDTGCADCCSEPVPVTEDEMVRVVTYANARDLKPQTSDPYACPWFQDGRCAVYEARPFVCMAFGHLPELECPRGYNENVSVLDARKLRALLESEGRTYFLHEASPDSRWMGRVYPPVWEAVQEERQRAGLPLLSAAL